MTDIQELMKSSDTMRMLKMGNPERSKDFALPKMDIGLFDIEKIVKEPLEKAAYDSPDPNGAIANFDTAMMLNNLGVDMESAHNMANAGFSSSVTGIDTADKTFGEAFGTTIKHASWQEMRGVNTSLYMLSGDFKFMENAHEYSDKVFKNPIRNEYGELGDLVLSGIQPTMSMMKFMSTAALVSWIPAGMAAKFGGVGLKALAAGGKVAAPLINMVASGYSQGGNVMYDVMQVKDIDGKSLPWDTTTGQALFHALSLTMGVVEVGSMEFFPWYRQINSYFTTGELAKQLERGLVAGLKNFFWEGAKGTASEAMEEGVQTGLGLGFENILRAMAKKKGAKFEQIPIGEIARDMARDTWEAGKSMVLTSFLTAGIGQSAVGIKMNTKSSKNFNRSKTSFTIDKSFINTKADPNTTMMGTLNKEQQADATEPAMLEPIKIVQDGHRAIPINAEELQKARDAESRGSEVYEVEVVDSTPIGSDQQEILINQAALSTDGQILDENTIVYETAEDRDRGVFLLAPNVESYKKNGDSMDLIIRDESGEISTISLKVAEEGMDLVAPDASRFTNPDAPYSLARVTADQALVWQEKNIIRKAIGDAVAHTKGRISSQALEASVDAMKIVSDTIGVPVDELLKDGLVFKLVQSEDGERGWTEDNITVDGKKQYTIGITERGDAKTIIHEIGHFLRGTATKEQLAEFTQHYGQGKEGVWIEDINQVGDKFFIGDTEYATRDEAFAEIEVNEERFAEDFVTYFATGIAPTEGLAKVFERMKNVLKAMMDQYKWEIDPEVKAAFDSLFTGEIQGSLDTNLEVGGGENILFDRTSSKEIDKQYFEALERGDTEAAQKIIDAQAVAKGYISDMEYRMQHKAPNGSDDFSANLAKIEETDLIPKDYWTHPQYYLSDGERTSFYRVKNALERYKENGKANLKLYRAVDKNIKEEKFRNGDWVTPDSEYARDHGSGIPGGYKIISQAVPLEHIYWDVNSIAELGYDDGEAYAYKDTKNNRKLTDVITRDFDGEIIPPSKRFNYREYYKFFDKAPQVGSEEFNDLFENTEVIDENGKPMMVYHGSPNAGIESFNTDLIYASNSEETATDFSYEQLPGSSNFTFVPGDQGEVYPMYMNIENPLDFRNLSQEDFTNIKDAIQKYNPEAGIQLDLLKNAIGKNPAHQHMKFVAEDLVNHLKEYGYDGLIAEMTPGGPLEFAAMSPDQVRQAEGRNKLYDKADRFKNWEPEITSTGTIKGAPEWVKTRSDLHKLRRLLRQLVKEGESGRFWYEDSAKEVWRIVQGDPDKAFKLLQVTAIYSAHAAVTSNVVMAIRAYNHWLSGMAEADLNSGTGENDEKAKRALYHSEGWEGRKTDSFFQNLIYELVRLHPDAFPDMNLSSASTMDLWMARVFGYDVEAYSDDKGTGKYSFSENSTSRVAAELNAKLSPGDQRWTPHQVQAAIWSAIKTRYELQSVKDAVNKESLKRGYSSLDEDGNISYSGSNEKRTLHHKLWREYALKKAGTSEEVTKEAERTGFSYKEAFYDSTQIVTYEVIPSPSINHPITIASQEAKTAFTNEALSIIVDVSGVDTLARDRGFQNAFVQRGDGAYDSTITPNIITNLVPTRKQNEGISFDAVRNYARDVQYIFKQNAVPFFKPSSMPLITKAAEKEMVFKVVKYTRNETGEVIKTTTLPKTTVKTQSEADALRYERLDKEYKKNPNFNADDIQVHGGKYATAVVLTFDKTLNSDILSRVLSELQEYLGEEIGFTRTGENDITIINFRDDFTQVPWMYDEEFEKNINIFYDENIEQLGLVRAQQIYTEGEYGQVDDWSESGREGTEESYRKSFPDKSPLLEGVLRRRALFEELLKKYTKEYISGIDRAGEAQQVSNRLYLLSEESKNELLESRKEEVKTAVENFYYIPTEILAEYIVEEWADSELMFRAYIDNTPWLLEEARNYENTDDFIDHIKAQTDDPDYKWVDQDDSWFKRIHAYARIMDPAEKDARFVRIHIGTDKNLVEFGKKLRRYQDVGDKNTVVSKWGAFKDVSTKVKTLTDSSTAEQLAEARSLIQKNPRPYRRAMQVIDQAQDRVSSAQGDVQVGEASRDAFYDALGEEMLDALNEPLLLNQMTTKESAAYLRTTTDKAEQYSAREKLATHEGVLAMERQANAELKRQGAEKDSDIKSLERQLSKANAEVSKLQEKVAAGKKVSKDLTVKKNEVKRLTRLLATKVKQVDAMKLRKEIEKFHKKLLATVEYNPDTIDVSFEEAFNALHELFKLNQKAGEMKALPEVMNQYLPENMVPMVQEGRSIAKWNLGELQVIYEAAKLMREDARYILNQKKAHRANKLQNLATQMYRQQYGEMPDIGAGYGSVVNDIIDDLTLNRKGYDENIFDAVFQTVKASIGKMQRISRMIDGNQEGIMYDLLVREAYNRMTEELRESYRRLTEADAKMKSLEITANTLVKDAFTHTTRSGEKKTLSKAEVIGLYVYSQNPIGLAKLTHNRGNNIAPYDLDRAIGSLSVNERAWGDYMIDNLGGDEVWTRMDETYRDVYNMSLGRRERYFTFVAEGSLNEGKTDLLAGPEGKSIRYVDKGFTKIINPNAIYPLKLNTNHTFVSQVKRQEHFIQWADWVRDMNYLMERGAIGRIVEMNHGPKYTRVIQEYINNVGSPQIILDDIERLGSKLVSNAGVAALSLNALVSLKQAGSYAAVVRGDIGAVELAHATLRMSTPSGFKEATEFIYEMSPYMLKRSISVEIDRYNASDFDTKLGRGVQSFNEKIGMKGISMIDHAVVSPMWLAAYDTYINRNVDNLEGEALTKEAAFRATQMISETQPSSIPTDLASIQMKKSPWVRSALLFSNQIFQYLNMTWYDIPGSLSAYHANHDKKFLKAAVGSTVSLALSGAMIILASGAAFRKKDEPDEKYWKRMRTEIAKTTAVYFIPIVGSAVSEGMTGFSGSDIVDLPAKLGRFMATDWTKKERISKNLWDLAGALGSTQALPVAFTKRLVKFSNKGNPFEMLGANYADLWERWVE